MHTQSTIKPPTLRLAAAAAILLSLAGCASFPFPDHLHDQKRQDTAEKLKKDLEAYAANTPQLYAAMQTNVEKFRVEEDALVEALGNNSHQAFLIGLLNMDKAGLHAESCQIDDIIDDALCALAREAQLARTGVKNTKVAIGVANKEIAEQKKKVASAKADVTLWSETIALLKQAASQAHSPAEETKSEKAMTTQDAVNSLGDSLKSVGNTEVSFEDADGATQKKKIRAVLGDLIQKDGANKLNLRVPHAPGITVRILLLGLQLAENELAFAQARLVRDSERLQVYENVYKELILAREFTKDANLAMTSSALRDGIHIGEWFEEQGVRARDHRDALTTVVKPAAGEVRAKHEQNAVAVIGMSEEDAAKFLIAKQDAEERAKTPEQKDAEQRKAAEQKARQDSNFDDYTAALNGNAELFRGLRLLCTARGLAKKNAAFIEIESKRLKHLDSVLQSQYNDKAWQLHFQAAADGLVAYHRGGFSKEDAAQIVRIAQAIGVGVIASHSN